MRLSDLAKAFTVYHSIFSTDEDPCAHTTPCQNGGTCMTTGPDHFECQCVEGYEGDRCELIVTDECDPDPCQNRGTCTVRHSYCLLHVRCSGRRD